MGELFWGLEMVWYLLRTGEVPLVKMWTEELDSHGHDEKTLDEGVEEPSLLTGEGVEIQMMFEANVPVLV